MKNRRIEWLWIAAWLVDALAVTNYASAEQVIRGSVRSIQGVPIADATVRIFASRPQFGNPSTVPIMHADCMIAIKTDDEGGFLIPLPNSSNENEVVLVAGKSGYLMQRTRYLTTKDEGISMELEPLSACKLPTSIKSKLLDVHDKPIANAVIGYEDSSFEPDLYNEEGKVLAALTNNEGEFELPSDETLPERLVTFVPGVGRCELLVEESLLSRQIPFVIESGFTVTGRVTGSDGPVADYVVCVSHATTHAIPLLLVVATRANGEFVIEGVPFTNRFSLPIEHCIFGDFTQLDARGHLETKRFNSGTPGQTLDFGDLKIQPVTDLEIRFLVDEGRVEDPRSQVSLSFPQSSRILRVPIPDDGVVRLQNIPREAIQFSVYAGKDHNYSSSNSLQSLSSESGFYFKPGQQRHVDVKLKYRKPSP